MKVQFKLVPHVLKFRFEAGTSRGSFTEKPTWYILATDENGRKGIGEASPLKGLSVDYTDAYEQHLRGQLQHIESLELPEEQQTLLSFIQENIPADLPSVLFGIEVALLDLINGGTKCIFPGAFFEGQYRMPINGLIWMGDEEFMQKQIDEKLKAGFNTIKMKIGAIDFDTELQLLENIRKRYGPQEVTLRVDANGAFDPNDVRDKLLELAALQIHSIEQPLAKGQLDLMASLCEEAILPIALDEELIGVYRTNQRIQLLDRVKPQFIILKPSLIGGILATQEWIKLAEARGIGWWMTSMLESNIGLNAIAQLTSLYQPELPQGLGTGQLYHNNWESPLEIRKGKLLYHKPSSWANVRALS